MHTITAERILGATDDPVEAKRRRNIAKALNFGLIYSMGSATLQKKLRADAGYEVTLGQADRLRLEFFALYPGLKAWHKRQTDAVEDIRTALGRRRQGVYDLGKKLNTPIQATAADGLKQALALLWERKHQAPSLRLVGVIHDEIVVEVREEGADAAEALVYDSMIEGMGLFVHNVPIDATRKRGHTWAGG